LSAHRLSLAAKVPVSALLEAGYIQPGRVLYFRGQRECTATATPDGRLRTVDGFEGSIHQAGSHCAPGAPCSGWEHWFFEEDGALLPLDVRRQRVRSGRPVSGER
jgi:modification methylase